MPRAGASSSAHHLMSLRVGIIGFGGAGRAHLSYLSCVDGLEVRKVYAPKAPEPVWMERLNSLGVQFVEELAAFWGGLDVVSICSPDRTHADYIVEALGRGVHVLCEKPLCDSVEGVARILEAEETSAAVLAVMHQMRFVPVNQKAKSLMVSGELGNVALMEGYYVHDLRGRAFQNDEWRRTDNATPTVYSGCHFVDLLRWLADDEIEEVYAAANHLQFPEYPESDLNLLTLRFRNGMLGTVVVAFGSAGPQDHSLRIYGSERKLENNVLFGRGGEFERITHRPDLIHKALLKDPIRSNMHGLWPQLKSNLRARSVGAGFELLRRVSPAPNSEYGFRFYPLRLYEHAAACVAAIEDFVDAIRTGAKPTCSARESAKAVLACLAAVDSYRSGQPRRLSDYAA